MRTLIPTKLIFATLLWIVFLFGGAGLASAQTSAGATTANQTDKLYSGLTCVKWYGGLEMSGCLAMGVYIIVYKPTALLLEGSAYIFDQILSLSIEGGFVAPAFINSSWTVVRDFSNMLFIFILIYAGIMTMFGAKDWKRTVLWVVVMALLINFSLFFTKIVIDAGNVLAVGIKSSITIPGQSISEGLAGAFKPQSFLSTAGTVTPWQAIVVFIVAAIVSGFVAYIFFKAAILFSRRLIVFWGLMILSPFAFISIALPGKANKFQGWLGELTSQAFAAPIFLFFIYLIMQVVNAQDSAGGRLLDIKFPGNTWFTGLLGPVMVAALLVKALQEALKFTEDFAGSTGEGFSKLVSGAMGLAGGNMVGKVGRTVIGGSAAYALAKGVKTEEELANMSPAERARYQRSRAVLQHATRASFDVRNLGGKDSIFGEAIGGKISEGVGAFGVGKGSGVGGVEKAAKDREKKAIDSVPKLSIFEEQEISRRAGVQAGNNKAELAKAEAELEAAQKAYKDSGEAEELAKAKAAVTAATTTIAEASKKTREAQAAFDAAKASGSKSLAPWEALNDARKAEEKAMQELASAESDITVATTKYANSAAVVALNTATEVAEKARGKELSSQKIAETEINAENDRRRKHYANEVEEFGVQAPFSGNPLAPRGIERNTHTANKIRKGEESGHAKKAKELAKELKEAKEAGAHEAVIKNIEEKIEKHAGNK